jgi:hypothetical protein
MSKPRSYEIADERGGEPRGFTWRHAIVRHVTDGGRARYAVHEAHFHASGQAMGHIAEPILSCDDGFGAVESPIRELEMMPSDVKKRGDLGVVDENEFTREPPEM